MNSERMVFSQLMDYLPLKAFHRCVERHQGNRKVLSFSCLDQFLCLAFAQLTYRESLRAIEACLRFAGTKLYHNVQLEKKIVCIASATRMHSLNTNIAVFREPLS